MERTTDSMETMPVTRRSLHGLAELLLAGPQYRRSGTIRLRVVPGGFATVSEPDLRFADGMILADGQFAFVADGFTCARLGGRIGSEAGAPEGLYQDGSGVLPDEELRIDAADAAVLMAALAVGEAALRTVGAHGEPVLWPEHFDLGVTVGEVNFGVSLGDGFLGEPYAYVGPWKVPAGKFWNAPFGAARTLRELGDDAAVADYFAEGRRQPLN